MSRNTTSTMTLTVAEILETVKPRQSVWAGWMQAAIEGRADTDLLECSWNHLPFGSYLMSMTPAAN